MFEQICVTAIKLQWDLWHFWKCDILTIILTWQKAAMQDVPTILFLSLNEFTSCYLEEPHSIPLLIKSRYSVQRRWHEICQSAHYKVRQSMCRWWHKLLLKWTLVGFHKMSFPALEAAVVARVVPVCLQPRNHRDGRSSEKFVTSHNQDCFTQLIFLGTWFLADTNLRLPDDVICLCPPSNLPPTSSLFIFSLPHLLLPPRYSFPHPSLLAGHLLLFPKFPPPSSSLQTIFQPSPLKPPLLSLLLPFANLPFSLFEGSDQQGELTIFTICQKLSSKKSWNSNINTTVKVCSPAAHKCTLERETQYLIQYKEECGRRYKKVSNHQHWPSKYIILLGLPRWTLSGEDWPRLLSGADLL